MIPLTRQLYIFLSACGGNWRNTLFISCREREDGSGYLLAADRDGCPVIMAVEQFHQLTGVWIDPTECCGQISEASFEAMYAQYLLWHTSALDGHPLRVLCQEPTSTPKEESNL